MKLRHDDLWSTNPDTAEEFDELEKRRRKAMRTAFLVLALVVALNVAVNEFSCIGPSAKQRGGAPATQQSDPVDQGRGGQGAAGDDGAEPGLSLDIAPEQAEMTRVDHGAVVGALEKYCKEAGIEASRAYVAAVLSYPSSAASSYLEVELLGPDGAKVGDAGVAYSLDYGTATVVPLDSLTGGSEPPERIAREGGSL